MPIFTNEMIKDHALYKEGKEEGIELAEKELRALKQQVQKEKQQAQKEKQRAQKKEIQAIINLHTKGVDIKIIADSYNISQKRVKEVIANWETQVEKNKD